MTSCLNCGNQFNGNFCPNCGQKASIKRLTFPGLVEDTIHFFTHLEKGFLYTTWNFFARPGNTSLNYLKGKRKKYQPPVSYFLIWTGLYILVHNTIINHNQFRFSEVNIAQLSLEEQANILLRTHFTLFIIPILFIAAFFIYAILGRPRYNFTEIITLCLYGGGTYFMMLFFSDIILGAIFKVNTITTKVFLWQTILSSIYNFLFSFDIFKRVHLRFFWWRLLSVAILIAVFGWMLMIYLPMAWIYFER